MRSCSQTLNFLLLLFWHSFLCSIFASFPVNRLNEISDMSPKPVTVVLSWIRMRSLYLLSPTPDHSSDSDKIQTNLTPETKEQWDSEFDILYGYVFEEISLAHYVWSIASFQSSRLNTHFPILRCSRVFSELSLDPPVTNDGFWTSDNKWKR